MGERVNCIATTYNSQDDSPLEGFYVIGSKILLQ